MRLARRWLPLCLLVPISGMGTATSPGQPQSPPAKGEPNSLFFPLETRLAGLRSPNASTRAEACQSLGDLRLKAKDAVPALVGALKDTDGTVVEKAAEALARIGAIEEVL